MVVFGNMALYFFSGKGGVGKTHLATSFAMHQSQNSRKCLLVEFSESAQYSEYFNMTVGFSPVPFKENLHLSTWTGKDCLGEYVAKILKSKKAADFFIKMPMMERLINAAPGLKEIAVLGKLTSDYRAIDFSTGYDDIIFDAPSSGHFISLLSVPGALGSLVGFGPLKSQCEEILESLELRRDVFFAVIDDGSAFAKKEAGETISSLQKVIKGKNFNSIENYSQGLKGEVAETWLEHAEQISDFWKNYGWSV